MPRYMAEVRSAVLGLRRHPGHHNRPVADYSTAAYT